MGARKRKLAAFLNDHPACFFCGAVATTIDHVPSRECFRDRIGPEGYEFPACSTCNNSAGPIEQVVALYLVMSNQDGLSSKTQMAKLIRGVRNNNPSYLPMFDVTANEKRRALEAFQYRLPRETSFSQAPIARLPADSDLALKRFARRLTCALFYKHAGHVMPMTHFMRTFSLQAIAKSADELIREMLPMLPNALRTQRQNTNIGNQFLYAWYLDPQTRTFALLSKFSESFVFIGTACHQESYDGAVDYSPHASDFT